MVFSSRRRYRQGADQGTAVGAFAGGDEVPATLFAALLAIAVLVVVEFKLLPAAAIDTERAAPMTDAAPTAPDFDTLFARRIALR